MPGGLGILTVVNTAAAQTEPTMPTYSNRTCRRCKGTGQHSNYGGDTRCFNCKGAGVEQVESGQRALTAAERESWISYLQGEAYRMDRERDRAIRRAARAA
jgi:DnaJ-class molecular chaperone